MTPTLNTIEAAELLKVHPKTVEELIHSGAIPAAKIGRAWVMLTADVLAFVEREIVKQTAARLRAPLAPEGGKQRGADKRARGAK